MQVSVAPTNTLYLDEYYNGLEGIKKRKYSYTEKPKSFGQSLKDLFFPNVRNPNRKIVKVKKPHLSFVPSPLSVPGPEVRLGHHQEADRSKADTFPYKFLKPIEAPNLRPLEEVPRSSVEGASEVDTRIDEQLVSPSSQDSDFKGR